jgi:hypothetical protein
MFFIGCAQRHVKEADGPSENTLFFTRQEKEYIGITQSDVDIFNQHNSHIGRVPTWFMDKNHNLMVIGELFFDHPQTESIMDDIDTGIVKWGLGLVMTVEVNDTKCVKKRITALELTIAPTYDTWIIKASTSIAPIKEMQQSLLLEQ